MDAPTAYWGELPKGKEFLAWGVAEKLSDWVPNDRVIYPANLHSGSSRPRGHLLGPKVKV